MVSAGNGNERDLRVLAAGDTAFVVEFGDAIDRALNARVMALHRAVAAAGIPGIVETLPTFRSLMVFYDPLVATRAELEPLVVALAGQARQGTEAGRLWRLPVCYEGEFAPDLAEIAQRTGLTVEQVVALHSEATYFAYVLGFMPGFAYLGGLPKPLDLPRRKEPRVRVPQNSVAIAGEMTAIYPWESPGGWHLIGRTPVALFDLRRERPILWGAGDEVRFARIDRATHDGIAAAVAAGSFDHARLEARR
ncbi:MAG: 5-oxoprolinase subunit PxpB [Reyranellaceae bacterium]